MNWPHAYIMPDSATPLSSVKCGPSSVFACAETMLLISRGFGPDVIALNPSEKFAGPTRAKSVSAWFMVGSARLLLEPSMVRNRSAMVYSPCRVYRPSSCFIDRSGNDALMIQCDGRVVIERRLQACSSSSFLSHRLTT